MLTAPPAGGSAVPAPTLPGYRFELVKLLAQWRVRLLLLACWLAPTAVVGVVSRQAALPTDTVFGRWMPSTGWAGALVVLAFSCTWALPLLTSLVAGDVFAVEDRLGTWRHLLVAVRSPRRIFLGKALASTTVVVLLVLGLAVSGTAGGLLAAGGHALVGLDGHVLRPGEAAATVALAWACVLPPTLAFAAVGLLGSVALGRSSTGLVVPAALALLLQLAQLLPLPVPVRLALPSGAFLAWRGLFTSPVQAGPLLVGLAVSLVWAAAATTLARWLFLRRDFTDLAHDGSGRRVLGSALLLGGVTLLTVPVLAVATPAAGTGISRATLQDSLATAFAHLYRLQTRQLHRPAVTETRLRTSASCDKGGSLEVDAGPGNDWRCVVSWHLPGTDAVGAATYQLDVRADGRYVADGDGPKEVNGYFVVRAPSGTAPNPLWQLDGLVDLLTTPQKG